MRDAAWLARGFGCTKCHDFLGAVSTGTRGPDLAKVAERVHFAWYDRWMIDPQKIQPGTRMPTVFLNGKSPYVDVLGGDAAQQRLAIWHYLSHAKDFPPPEGLEPPKPAEIANAKSGEYQTLRTFLPDVTPRSMAIRGPDGVNFAYDLQACRLAYAWSGDFLDTTPVWDGRGGQPARIKGPVFWHSPTGFPWDLTVSANSIPDFATHANDTALGAALPQDGKLHPTRLDFHGYRLVDGDPQFRYELRLDGAVGLVRRTDRRDCRQPRLARERHATQGRDFSAGRANRLAAGGTFRGRAALDGARWNQRRARCGRQDNARRRRGAGKARR